MTTATDSKNITIKNVTYSILQSETVDEIRAKGLNNYADFLAEQGTTREMLVRRPRGRKHFLCREVANPYGGTYAAIITSI